MWPRAEVNLKGQYNCACILCPRMVEWAEGMS